MFQPDIPIIIEGSDILRELYHCHDDRTISAM